MERQAATLFNHLPFLKMDISVALKVKAMSHVCVPCLAHWHTGVGFTAGFNRGWTAEEEHCVQENQIVSPVFLAQQRAVVR